MDAASSCEASITVYQFMWHRITEYWFFMYGHFIGSDFCNPCVWSVISCYEWHWTWNERSMFVESTFIPL